MPALAVVPGGSTNVFARALGLPKEWTEGTGVLLDALHAGRFRPIGLGRADGRYFTFCAGFGLDAEVVRKVERARLRGKVSTPALYMRSLLTQFFLETDRPDAAASPWSGRASRPSPNWPTRSSRTPRRGPTWVTGRSTRARTPRSTPGWT